VKIINPLSKIITKNRITQQKNTTKTNHGVKPMKTKHPIPGTIVANMKNTMAMVVNTTNTAEMVVNTTN